MALHTYISAPYFFFLHFKSIRRDQQSLHSQHLQTQNVFTALGLQVLCLSLHQSRGESRHHPTCLKHTRETVHFFFLPPVEPAVHWLARHPRPVSQSRKLYFESELKYVVRAACVVSWIKKQCYPHSLELLSSQLNTIYLLLFRVWKQKHMARFQRSDASLILCLIWRTGVRSLISYIQFPGRKKLGKPKTIEWKWFCFSLFPQVQHDSFDEKIWSRLWMGLTNIRISIKIYVNVFVKYFFVVKDGR